MNYKFKSYFDVVCKNIDNIIWSRKLEGKHICMFGLQRTNYAIEEYLNTKGYQVTCYTDNNSLKRLQLQNEHLSYSPEEVRKIYGLNVFF